MDASEDRRTRSGTVLDRRKNRTPANALKDSSAGSADSAGEVRSHLAVAMAWGDVDQATVTPALSLLDSILAILWRLTHP